MPAAIASGLPPKVEPWVPGVMPLAASAVASTAPIGKPRAEPLGQRHDVGRHAELLIAEQLAEPADAGLHLVEREQQAVLVAELRAAPGRTAAAPMRTPPSPCTGSIRMPAVSGVIARLTASRSPSGTWSKPSIAGPKPSRCFLFLAAASVASVRPWNAAFEGDDAVALGMAVRRLVLAHHLDDAFHRLGAGIGEEHHVGEAHGAQPVGQPLALGNAVEVGDVDDLLGLLGDRLDQMRMRMAERIDRDAGGEIEIALAVGRDQPNALAPLESEVDPRVGRQHRCDVTTAHLR